MTDFHGPNVAYVLELYERYRAAPESVDAQTRAFFANWTPPTAETPSDIVYSNGTTSVAAPPIAFQKAVAAVNYAQAIRLYGHLAAKIDPLDLNNPPSDPELNPDYHGISEDELRSLPPTIVDGPISQRATNALEAIEMLKAVYCGSIGYDLDHIRVPQERQWLRDAVESGRYHYGQADDPKALLARLTQVEAFENFLQKMFPTKYRFSIEGLDVMVPMLDAIIDLAGDSQMSTIAIAMAHRGRLNVLTHIMGKPYRQILVEFKDALQTQELQEAIGYTIGDVKYHKGLRRIVETDADENTLAVTMPPNPSHLEAINPVAVGMARAAGSTVNRAGPPTFDSRLTMQILIHGDAAFPGQGLVAETFNLSQLPGYWTGGTLHIIANNQVGFTTLPIDGRSTLYASDLAKGFKVPIVHVNADDPAACIEVVRLAFAYQEVFEKDFLIDLVGYRRYGHNELDEPGFTQPIMYQRVRNHQTVRQIWADRLIHNGIITASEAEAFVAQYGEILQQAYDTIDETEIPAKLPQPEPGIAGKVETAVPADTLLAINEALKVPQSFNFFSKRLENTIRARRDTLNDPNAKTIDWATAEELAFATILADGTPIRLTGQDSERGTFSHRHAVINDSHSGRKYTPLQQLSLAQAAFEVRNSPLSESAALGFEYGYNTQAPERLVLWEAQYGDFNNNAQVIIDEFIVSAREKWGQTPSLVLLLPHGHEGGGPDHSSARPERYLQMAAKLNIRIANATTAAQYFHLLRRQALLLTTDPLPLVIMAPKSLLRNAAVYSSMNDLTHGRWQPVIDDDGQVAQNTPTQITRLVLCSGKFYYDLIGATPDLPAQTHRADHPEVAIARVEQLYPFPARALDEIIQRYPNLKEIVWAQEEPKNMGAWDFMNWRLKKLIKHRLPVNYVGRRRSSSPAEGSKTAHIKNQSMIVDYTYNWDFTKGEQQD
ncbi:MAG: 2-oxoglutarate dehydrogenase E1 component [Anaerolineae bacterium]|jgi:2-oxoglutarate dehydrogenase E1 component|nr:2-oxoglutarate dehydrogenase E1 component [Anaerolineae bacterium]